MPDERTVIEQLLERIADLETLVFELQRQGQILRYAPDSRLDEAHQRLIGRHLIERDTQRKGEGD